MRKVAEEALRESAGPSLFPMLGKSGLCRNEDVRLEPADCVLVFGEELCRGAFAQGGRVKLPTRSGFDIS